MLGKFVNEEMEVSGLQSMKPATSSSVAEHQLCFRTLPVKSLSPSANPRISAEALSLVPVVAAHLLLDTLAYGE